MASIIQSAHTLDSPSVTVLVVADSGSGLLDCFSMSVALLAT